MTAPLDPTWLTPPSLIDGIALPGLPRFVDSQGRSIDLAARVAAVRAIVAESPPGQPWLIAATGRAHFAAALIGTWFAGRQALLPQTMAPATLEAWAAQDSAGLLHDAIATPPDGAIDVRSLPPGKPPGTRSPTGDAPHQWAVDDVMAILCSSGSTQQAHRHAKTAGQLFAEARMLAETFGFGEHGLLVATVPCHHIYGLLFTLLAPWIAGGAVLDETPLHAATIADRIARPGVDRLVTVPAHLRTLAGLGRGPLSLPQRIFSSGAPLPPRIAERLHDATDTTITEVFGSTETGGIGWRCQRHALAWTTLPDVMLSVDADDCLLVDSPWLPPDATRPMATEDRALLIDAHHFEHRGRRDDVVKIASIRVSLDALIEHLEAIDGIEEAAVVTVERADREPRLHGLIVGSTQALSDAEQSLRRWLPGSTLPRLHRVDALPRTSTGKFDRAGAIELIIDRSAPSDITIEADADSSAGEAVFCVRLPGPRAKWFEGHFKDLAILPAVVQIERIVLPAIEMRWPGLGPPRRLIRLKFRRRLRPNEHLRLSLDRSDATVVNFSLCTLDGQVGSTGRLQFDLPVAKDAMP